MLVLGGICGSWYPKQLGVRKLRAAASPLVTYNPGSLHVVVSNGVTGAPPTERRLRQVIFARSFGESISTPKAGLNLAARWARLEIGSVDR